MWLIQVLLHSNIVLENCLRLDTLVQKCVTVVTVYITHPKCGSADFTLKRWTNAFSLAQCLSVSTSLQCICTVYLCNHLMYCLEIVDVLDVKAAVINNSISTMSYVITEMCSSLSSMELYIIL